MSGVGSVSVTDAAGRTYASDVESDRSTRTILGVLLKWLLPLLELNVDATILVEG